MSVSERKQKKRAYRTLGLKSGASEETVRSAYIELVKKYHPDSGNSKTRDIEQLKNINAAFQTLKVASRVSIFASREVAHATDGTIQSDSTHRRPIGFYTGLAVSLCLSFAVSAGYLYEANLSKKPQAIQAITVPQFGLKDIVAPGKGAFLPRKIPEKKKEPASKQDDILDVGPLPEERHSFPLQEPPAVVVPNRQIESSGIVDKIALRPVSVPIAVPTVRAKPLQQTKIDMRPVKHQLQRPVEAPQTLVENRDPPVKDRHTEDVLAGGL